MKKQTLATHGFALFCFLIALYLSVGGYLQYRFGLWGITLNEIVFLLIPALLYPKLTRLSMKKVLPFSQPIWWEILLVLLLTAIVITPIETLIHYQNKILPLPQSVEAFYEGLLARETWVDGLIQVFALALVPAFCEELFFRGLLQSMFEPRFGTWKGILLTSFFFAIAHVNPWYILYYFLLGIYFGWLRHWKNNLALCIFAHFLNNLYSLFG